MRADLIFRTEERHSAAVAAWELRDRSKHFGVTEQQLKDAVAKVGVMTVDVKRHLGN